MQEILQGFRVFSMYPDIHIAIDIFFFFFFSQKCFLKFLLRLLERFSPRIPPEILSGISSVIPKENSPEILLKLPPEVSQKFLKYSPRDCTIHFYWHLLKRFFRDSFVFFLVPFRNPFRDYFRDSIRNHFRIRLLVFR